MMFFLRIYMINVCLLLLFGLTTFDMVMATWCSPKKEKFTQLDQLTALSDAAVRCHDYRSLEAENKTALLCPTFFDGLMCWPKTRPGTISKLQCPGYVHGFNTAEYATKECLLNGEWLSYENRTITNYTGCFPAINTLNQKSLTITELIKDPTGNKWKRFYGLSLERDQFEHMEPIQILYRTGYAVSLIFLLIAVFIMTTLSKIRCQRNIIHINLFISFILRCVVCFIKDEHGIPDDETGNMEEIMRQITSTHTSYWCKFVHVLFFYILVANYMWIFVEGIYLHTLIFVTTFHNISQRMFRTLIIFGWVSPFLCVLPWVITRIIYENTLCWNLHNPENGYVWIIQGPIVATLVINFVFFLNIIRVLFTKLSANNSRDPKCYRKLARSTLVLIPLFGVHYIVFMAIPICLEPKVEIVWMYTELFFSSFQGFIVSMLFCFLNDEVKNEIKKHWKWHMLRRQSLVSSRSTRTFSIHSSNSGREQGSPYLNEKNKNSFLSIKGTDSSNSLGKDMLVNHISNSEIFQNDIQEVDCDLSSQIKDDNENVPFILGEKVSFF